MALLLHNITCKNKNSSGDSSLHTYLDISLILQVADIRPVSGLIFHSRSGRFSHPRLSEPWAVSGRTWAFLCCLYRARSPIIFFAYFAVFTVTSTKLSTSLLKSCEVFLFLRFAGIHRIHRPARRQAFLVEAVHPGGQDFLQGFLLARYVRQ